jgi:arylsulfatase A-like enzyme
VLEGKNAPPTSNYPLRAGKGYLYEGGIRVPLIVRWPGKIKPDSVCKEVTSSVDYYPTMFEIVGLQKPRGQVIDGRSILPLLRRKGQLPDRDIFWHYPHYSNQGGHPSGAIRSGNFKLIEFYEDNRLELYDLSKDMDESRNLAGRNLAKARELAQKLANWRRSVDAQMPRPNPEYDSSLARTLPWEQ